MQPVAVVEVARAEEGNGMKPEAAAEYFDRQNGWGTCLSYVSRGHAHERAAVRGPVIFRGRAL